MMQRAPLKPADITVLLPMTPKQGMLIGRWNLNDETGAPAPTETPQTKKPAARGRAKKAVEKEPVPSGDVPASKGKKRKGKVGADGEGMKATPKGKSKKAAVNEVVAATPSRSKVKLVEVVGVVESPRVGRRGQIVPSMKEDDLNRKLVPK